MKKIAIICGSPSSEFLAPFDDLEWEIWVLGNRLNRFDGKRVTRAFEIHDCLIEHKDPAKYVEYLVSHELPLIVAEKFPVKAEFIQTFDYAASEKLFGSLYLTSSPAYMMSQAISDGATHIGIYGVDLSIDDHEYFWQRPCMEAWIGFAKGRGIEITIPEVSHVGKSGYVEGRDWDGVKNNYNSRKSSKAPFTEEQFAAIAAMHGNKISDLVAQRDELLNKINAHSGSQQTYDRLARVARAIEAGVEVNSLSETLAIK
jgi:hypothetical protein